MKIEYVVYPATWYYILSMMGMAWDNNIKDNNKVFHLESIPETIHRIVVYGSH